MPGEVSGGAVYPKTPEAVHEDFGALGGCFVDGDMEHRQRERRIKSRSLVISLSLQLVVLAAVVLIPLFGKPERIALAAYVPIPPYSPYVEARPQTPTRPEPSQTQRSCIFCIGNLQSHPSTTDAPRPRSQEIPPGEPVGFTQSFPNQIPLGANRQPPPPPPPPPNPKVVHVTHLDPALLTHRVEPIYPVLAKQIRKEGQIQLHAIIGTDGSIQSLQYAGGDMMFFASARDAVQQWRYRPTILNGQPVEVDTTITVIYTLAH